MILKLIQYSYLYKLSSLCIFAILGRRPSPMIAVRAHILNICEIMLFIYKINTLIFVDIVASGAMCACLMGTGIKRVNCAMAVAVQSVCGALSEAVNARNTNKINFFI